MSLAPTALGSSELAGHFTPYDLKRLELYSRSMVDYHLIMDLVPVVARIFFLKQLGDMSLSAAQCVRFFFLSSDVSLFFLVLYKIRKLKNCVFTFYWQQKSLNYFHC